MQDFLGVPLLILAAILGSLSIFLLATGLCKAALLLRTPALPDIIPKTGSQTCHCALRVLTRNPAAGGIPCVINFEEDHTAPASKNPSLLTPKLEKQRKSLTLDTPLASSSKAPGNIADGKIAKIEFLSPNKEVPQLRSFH